MYQTRRLNDEEITKINEIYDIDYKVTLIQKKQKKYYAILDCDEKIEVKEKEVANYFM